MASDLIGGCLTDSTEQTLGEVGRAKARASEVLGTTGAAAHVGVTVAVLKAPIGTKEVGMAKEVEEERAVAKVRAGEKEAKVARAKGTRRQSQWTWTMSLIRILVGQ